MTANTVRARVVLEEARLLGLDLADLLAVADADVAIPTVAELVATIAPTFTTGTAATYRPYWRLMVDLHGDRRLAELDVTALQQVVDAAVERASNNRPGSTGRASAESCIAALRALYQRATAAGLVTVNPARALTKPRRPRPRRRALDEDEQTDLINAIRATSLDPDLDLLIVRFHLETGARRSGALALGRADLDERRATVWLTEKGSAREQPISPTLLTLLERRHAARAHGDPSVLRRRDGRPVTARDYDRLFARARSLLPWARRTPVSAHVLRHTAITAIAGIGGYPVAQAFAGHAPAGVTDRYVHAGLAEVAAAVAVMTGEPHPLMAGHGRARCQRR